MLVAGGALLGGVLLFSQTGLFLEIVGLGAAANVVYKNFFYAEDRERSTKKLKCASVVLPFPFQFYFFQDSLR